jgi:hypothetical protein
MQNFETQDIVLASALRTRGYKMTDIRKVGAMGTFCFDTIEDEDMKKYSLGELLVDPIAFNNMLKSLTTAVRRIT